MPLTSATFAATLFVPYAQVTFGTLTPNFDRLDAYADMSPLSGNNSVIWRLYVTSGGVRSLAAEYGPADNSFGTQRLFAIDIPSPSAVYELTGELTQPYLPGVTLKAGLVGSDTVVNDQPATSVTSLTALVYGTQVPYGTLPYHQNFQAEIDVAAAGAAASSIWRLFATITGGAGALTVLVDQQAYAPATNAQPQQVIIRSSGFAANSFTLTGQGTDPQLALIPPAPVRGSLSGFSEHLEGASATPFYQTVEDAGVALPQQAALNFIGATVADNPGNGSTDVTIPGGGITQLTQDVLAGPGAGSQAASVVEATGEINGPGGVLSSWFPNKAGSMALCNPPDGSPVAIYRLPGPISANPNTAYAVLGADAGDVYLGGTASGPGTNNTFITAVSSVAIYGTATRLVRKTRASANNSNQSLWQVSQPSQFVAAEVYSGGAAKNCDTGLLATTLIECDFSGGGAGTINLPSNNPGRVLHIADQSATISVVATLTLQPDPATSVGGGALGAPLVITTAGWAQKLVLNSAGNNWMIF